MDRGPAAGYSEFLTGAVSHRLALNSCKPLSTPASISLGCCTHLNGRQPHNSVPTPAPRIEGGGGGGEEVTCGFPGQHLETLPQGHKGSFPQGHRKPRPVPEGEEGQAPGRELTALGSAAGRPRGTSWSLWLEEECGTNFNRKPLPARKGRAPWARAHGCREPGRDLVLAFAGEQHYKHRRPPREVTCRELDPISHKPLLEGASDPGTRTRGGGSRLWGHPTQSCQTQGFKEMER